jgi:hypothetical protein
MRMATSSPFDRLMAHVIFEFEKSENADKGKT